ncbi:hypothetical protein PIB30_034032 [Stylosanthes scabra]|uniref:Uncharacterized protein n=1 Tax=Stylosanthes scabra TaxID=79078 RepID=A0ABU6XAR7_9FABA|nr:hypothetical protein [Stylosanthes scabra]
MFNAPATAPFVESCPRRRKQGLTLSGESLASTDDANPRINRHVTHEATLYQTVEWVDQHRSISPRLLIFQSNGPRHQLKEWTRNASYKDAYCCWAHQQSNSNLTEIPTYRIPELMRENAEKGRSIFYGFLKSDPEAGSSSQAAPAPHPQEDEQMAEPDS